MFVCKETYLFFGVGLLLFLAGVCWISSDSLELSTDSSEKDRETKNGLNVAGTAMILIAGLVLMIKGMGYCAKEVTTDDVVATAVSNVTSMPRY